MSNATQAAPAEYVAVACQYVYATKSIFNDETGVTTEQGKRGAVLFGQGVVAVDGATDVYVAFDGQAESSPMGTLCTLGFDVEAVE